MMDIPLESDRQVHGAFALIFFLQGLAKNTGLTRSF